MMRKIQFIFVFLFIIIKQPAAQAIYDSLLTELNSKYPQEKLYIHTDKSFYNPGEIVWIKVYIKSDNFPTPISTSIYTELVDDKNNILIKKVMPITKLGANFDFKIPDTVKNSRLYLRAYTTWMLNFNDLYSKAVNIVQPSTIKAGIAQNYSLCFFPEGGDLVAGIESKVAFKTNDSEGRPFVVKGDIIDEEGKNIQSFQSIHDGMGLFTFSPEARKRYKAVWADPTGKLHENIIPNSRTLSATLSVDQKDNRFLFTIKRPEEVIDDFTEFVIVGQMNQRIIYAARINMKVKTEVSSTIRVDSLSEGILQLTLFNKNQEPVAERICYVNGISNRFTANVTLVTKNLYPKSKNELQIDMVPELNTNLSISVIDDDQSPSISYSPNIISHFLMSSDLRGYVHNPGYYFSSDADSVKQHLDLVMMTNGWRRFKWQNLLAGNWPEIKFIPENHLTVEGKIKGLSSSELADRSITGLLNSGKDIKTDSYITININRDGFFKADKFHFFDTGRIFYQLSNDKHKRLTNKATFSFKTVFRKSPEANMPEGLLYSALPVAIAKENADNFELSRKLNAENEHIRMIENVTVKGNFKSAEEKIDEEYARGVFTTGKSRIFALDNDPFALSYRSVLEYLEGKVPGLQINISETDTIVSRRNNETDLFLDELQSSADHLLSVPISDVALIKVFDPPFVGASRGGQGGAIAVYLKKPDVKNSEVKGLNVAVVNGYSAFKEFYAPNYDKIISSIPDLRTTLYWNPNIYLYSNNNKVTLPFFNNSKAKRIRILLEGINEKGQVISIQKIFE